MNSLDQKPRLRFKGFTEAWEQRKLNEIVSYTSSSLSAKDVVDDGKWNLYDANQLIGKTNLFFVRDDYITIIKDGAGVGRVRLLPKNTAFIGTMGALLPFNSDLLFDYALLTKADLSNKFSGSTIPHIYFKDYGNEIYRVPLLLEQEKIGQLFDQLDSLFTLHQRKCNKLKSLKKALLEKMFPTNNEIAPKIRFKGFTEAWEQRAIKDLIIKGGSGGTPSTSNSSFYDGTIPFLSITDISNSNGFIFDTEKHITEEALNSSAAWIVPKESVSLAMYASVGKVAVLKENIATSQAFYNMIFKTIELRDYCFQYLKKMETNNEWLPYISTGTQANLNAEKVQSLKLQIPSEESEQRKLGQLFNSIDSLITLHQRKCEKLKNLKKSLLERMFI